MSGVVLILIGLVLGLSAYDRSAVRWRSSASLPAGSWPTSSTPGDDRLLIGLAGAVLLFLSTCRGRIIFWCWAA